MSSFQWLIILSGLFELILISIIIVIFLKLRKSQSLILQLQNKQEDFLARLDFNAKLEQELVSSFEERQKQLSRLDARLEQRANTLQGLLEQADAFAHSPAFLKQTILTGYRRGQSVEALARSTGLSMDEIEVIIDQEG
jgi:SRSO17 transposase